MNNVPAHPIVNRQKELSLISERLSPLAGPTSASTPVIFFYGVQMVGKTTLLQAARDKAAEHGVPTVLLDFDQERLKSTYQQDDYYDGEKGKVRLADALMSGLKKAADAPPAHPIKPAEDSADSAAEKLLEYIKGLQHTSGKSVALLFDTIEDAPPDVLSWLQNRILANLLEESQVFVMFAGWSQRDYQPSDQELRPRFIWPVSRRMLVHHLRPFDQKEAEALLQAQGKSLLWPTNSILEITAGLPGLIVHADPDNEAATLQSSVEAIFQRVASKQAEKVKDELLALSAFRQFDLRLLGKVVEGLWPDKHSGMNRLKNRTLLNELRGTTLVEQHPDGYGYVVPHDIRRVLDTYQRRQRWDIHFKTHCLAVRWFRDEVQSGDPVFIADELYHLAGVWRDTEEGEGKLPIPEDIPDGSNRQSQLMERLQVGLNKLEYHRRNDDLLEKIISVLNGQEFRWLLTRAEIEKLIAECESFKARLS